MRTGIGKWLQIDTGNRPMILALLLQAGCTGIFAGSIELAGNAVFLESYEADQIPLAMMVSGAVGIFIASIYSYFSKQLKALSFGILNLAVVVVLSVVLLFASALFVKRYFDFIAFVLTGPMLLVTLMGFWVTVKGYLSPSKGKELSGLIELALVSGMVLAFFAIPFLVKQGLPLRYMYLAGFASLILATVFQFFILRAMRRKREFPNKRVSSTGPIRLFSHRYTGLIASFAVLGVAVFVVLQYSFLWATLDQYTGGYPLVSFLGTFFGAMMALAWLMKRFLFPLLKKRYGIGVTLLATPVFLLIVSLAAAVVGDVYGYGAESRMIPYFFALIFLSRFFAGTWHGSLQDPSMNVILQSLNPQEKHSVKSGIEGILSQIGVFTIGLLLACFILVPFVEMIHVSYLMIALVMAWFFVGLALHRAYKRILQMTLAADRVRDQQELGLPELSAIDLQKTAFPVEAIEFNPYFFHYKSRKALLTMLDHAHPGVRVRVWDKLLDSSPGLPQLTLSQMLSSEHEPAIRARIRTLSQRKLRSKLGIQEAFIRERLDRFSDEKSEVDPAIDEAFHSGVQDEVFAALYHVAKEKDRSYLPEVVSLLKDKDLKVRSVAISTAGQMDSRRVTAGLMECLEHHSLYAAGWSALVQQGEAVLDDLEATFHKPASDSVLQRRIVSIMAAIGGHRAVELLLAKLDYHHKEVSQAVVMGLYENHFRANELQLATVQNAILRLVQTGGWNLAAKVSLRMENPGGYVDVAMDHEIWDVNEMILMLLAFIFGRPSVQPIRTHLLDKQSEDRGMAIELLDLLLNDPLKTVLISYFTDVYIREKIDKLHAVEHIELIPVDLLLRKILNRDGMQMGDFIRICVLERMGNVSRYFDEQQIIAQGFHPNPKIRETAAQILRKNDPGRFDLVTERLDFPDNSFPDHQDSARWYVNTTINLAVWKLFKDVGINSLFKLVSVLQPFSEELLDEGDMVVLARSESDLEQSPLSSGIAIIGSNHPEILEQIRYLGTGGAQEAYLVERAVFVELLFDNRSLLHVFSAFLNQS